MKLSKKLLCLVLAVVLAVGCLVPAMAQEPVIYTHEWDREVKTHCGGTCDASPVIVVPGIMQSQVYVQDEQGNDLLTSDGFPIVEGMDMAFMFDTVKLKEEFKKAIGSILLSVLKRDKQELLDIVMGILDDGFKSHYFNDDGTRKNDVAVDEYWHSLAVCKETPEKSYGYAKGYSKDENGNVLPTTKYKTEYDFIMRQVDISSYIEKYGADHTYYFSYSSFGDIISSAEALNEYVQMVKTQTGHSKVSIVFISLGGTIGNVYLSEFCNPADIDRVVFAAAAVNGSYLLGDLMDGASTLSDMDVIYNDLIPNLITLVGEEYMSLGYLGNAVARAIPEELFNDFLEDALTQAVNKCLGKLLRNCQSMWALVPGDMYPALSAKYISDESHAKLKARTDRYALIQKNAGATMKRLSDAGMHIFVICGYDLELPALVEHYNLSADNIIQASSTSVGGTFANVGSTLPSNYTPAINSTYISPDRIVDAGTCALPDHTWFIKGQSHLKLQSAINDVIELCVQLMIDQNITDARVNNGGYAQFQEYRDLSTVENLVKRYNAAKESGKLDALNAEKRASVENGYEQAQALLAKRTWSAAETEEVEELFYTAMYQAKLLSDDSTAPFVSYKLLPILTKIAKFISDVFEFIFGGNDYWLVSAKWMK